MTAAVQAPGSTPESVAEPSTEQATTPGRRRNVIGAHVLITLVVLCVWLLVYAFGLSRLQQTRSQHGLYAELRESLARGTTPVSAPITRGTPIALLQVPDAGIEDLVVGEGTASKQLMAGPGHLANTPLPGQIGVSVLLGRSVTFGAPFSGVDRLRLGDVIRVTTGQGVFRFRVDGLFAGHTLHPTEPAGTAALVLVTSRSSAVGVASGSQLEGVQARLVGRAMPAPAQLPSVAADEQPLAGDHSLVVRLELVLALQLLLVCLGVTLWLANRWGRRQAWTVGVPFVATALWLATGVAAQLLPNLI